MDYSKNYVLSLLRAESKESKKVQPRRKAAFESKKVDKFEEQRGEFYFNPFDDGMSGSKTYSFNGKVEIKSVGGDGGGLDPIEEVKDFNVLSPDLEHILGEEGYFMILKAPEGDYGFHFETEEGLMIYGYASTIDELKSQVELLGKYLDLPSIPWDDFVAAVDGVNEDTDDDESWRIEWKKGTGEDFGYDHNLPLLFKQTPDGKVSITLGKNPYGEEGYIGEVDFIEDSIVQQENTIEKVIDRLSDYGSVTSYFDLNMPSQDLLDYIESSNEEDLSMDDASIDTQEVSVDEAPLNEASKEYTFIIPCEVTVTVEADSEDSARDILMRSTEIELAGDVVEFAGGDAVLRSVDFSGSDIDRLDATNKFDYEE